MNLSSLDAIQNTCSGMRSSKVTDRKKAAEALLELLSENDGYCRTLDYNSMHKERDRDKLTWTTLFNEAKDYFSKETEKLATNHGGTNMSKTFYFSVVDRVMQKATCHRPWINWNRICDFIISHLSQPHYAHVYGTSLICMLQNFLSIELYVTIIDANVWCELIKLLIKVFGKYDIPKLQLLGCLNISIQEGSNHPGVISTLRSDVVNFFETSFASFDINKNRPLVVFLLRGATALCQRNAVEFRRILCKLGESVIPKILHSNTPTVDEEEGAIVEFLLVQLQLHSPCDVHIKSPAFYASNQKKWLEILKSIYSFCLDTIEDIATKKSNPFNKDLQASDKLILLAAKCTKQIFDSSQVEEHTSSDEDEPSTKKARRHPSFDTVMSDVCRMATGESQVVWINYLTATLIEFPSLVGTRMNYSCLFTMGLNFLNSNFAARREVYLFFLCLLKTEKYLISTDVLKNRSSAWETVWDITLRSLSINGSMSEALELLRSLLIEVQPSNVNGLLILYVHRSMPVSPPSLHLLAEYLSRCSLPLYMTSESVGSNVANIGIEMASTTCPRLSLIRWLVQSDEEPELGYEPLISAILCSLLVRQTHNLIYAEKFCHRPNSCIRISSELSQYEVVYDDFEKLLLNCCFVHIPEKGNHENTEITAQESLQLSLMPTAPGRLVEALQDNFDKLPAFDHSSSEFMKKFSQLNYRVALYLSILNILEKHSIGNEDALGFRTNLEKLFDKALGKCMETAVDFITKGKDKSASQVQEMISIMRNLLRSGHLCDKSKLILSQRFPQQMQELLKKVYRSNLTRYIERATNNIGDSVMFGGQDTSARLYFSTTCGESSGVPECRQIELAALAGLECLIDYGIICDHRIDLFSDILKDCISEAYNPAIPAIFEFSSQLISRLTPVLENGNCSELLTLVTNLLQKMCRGFYQVPHCSVRLWQLFADITAITANDSDVNKKNLMILVGTLSGFMKTGSVYGSSISVCQAGFRTLTEVAKNDPNLSWSVFTPKSGNTQWVLHELYEFLNNSSHQIRLFAAETIYLMYKYAAPPAPTNVQQESGSRTDTLIDKRTDYYEKIFQFLQKTYTVPANFVGEELAEEIVNRTTVAVLCLTRLIFAYPFIQKKSLFSLLKLVKVKKIEVSKVNRALNYESRTAAKTMGCHVSYLLQQWMHLNYPIEEFPYSFFGCETIGAFYKQFRKEISVEFFQKNDTEGLERFAKFFSLEILDLIKECYGMLMARIVPGLSVYTTKHPSEVAPRRDIELITQLQETQKRLTAVLGGKKETETLMMTSLGDVLLQLVSLVFDPLIPSAWGCPDIRLPEPAPPFHDESWIDTSVNFLKEASSRKDISIVAFLATYSAKSIYDTLLTLITRVHNAHDALEKFWRLHQFQYFVKQLLQEPQLIFSQMKEYVCQFVVYAYLRLLNSETGEDTFSKYLRHALIFLISNLVMILAFNYKEEMKQYYYPIVNGLVSSAIKYPDLIDAAKKPLDLLLKTYVDDYAECIVSLDPFPSHIEAFEEYKEIYLQMKYGQRRTDWPLQKELRSCLTEIQSSHGSCTKERLEFLRDLLSKRKKDLDRLVRSLEGKQFSDECTNETLHSLIQMLILVIKGEDEDAALEACRCLGEIGAVDLSVLVLPNCPSRKEIKKMVKSISIVVEIAAEYLKSDDIRVVSTTGEVIRSLCHMGECVELLNKEGNSRLHAILKPFKTTQPLSKTYEKVFAHQLETKLGLNEMDEFIDYSTWITQLTCGLIDCLKSEDSLTARLRPLCKLKVEFCQEVLPFVVYIILYAGKSNPLVRKSLSGYFRNFFSKFVHGQATLSENSRSITPIIGTHQVSIHLNKFALRSLLGVVQFLRNHTAPQEFKGSVKSTPWDNNLWLEVNYLELAKAAQHCGAYLTSILFAEIAATDLEIGGNGHIDDLGDEDPLEQFYSQGTSLFPRGRGDSFEKLLLKAYTSIGEPDAVYGCGSARFSDGKMNIRHLQQRMQWERVLSACDGNAVDSESSVESGVAASMREMGLYNTLWTYLQGIEAREHILDQELAEIQYECGWRLSKWNLHCDKATYVKDGSLSQSGKGHGLLQRYIYESVQTGIASDVVNHLENVRRGYTSVAKDLRHASLESSENLYGYLSQLQMLRVVEDFFHMETVDNTDLDSFFVKWKLQDRINASDFKFQEPVLYLRSILLRAYEKLHPRLDLEHAYDDCMLDLLSKARDSGRLAFAENCASCISSTSERNVKKDLEVAKNHWARGDQDIARHILGRQLKKSSPDGCDLYPVMLLLYGEWLSETMSERPSVILEKYFVRSCKIYEKRAGASQVETAKAHFVLAKYADTQYQNLSKYVKSDIFTDKVNYYNKAMTDVAAIASAQDMETRKSAHCLRKQSNIDEEEIRVTFDQRHKFLLLALEHYLKGLKDCNDQDLLIFRAVALWLENGEDPDNPTCCKEVNSIFKKETLPSYKYIAVLHQLSARMNGNSRGMTQIISFILEKCAQEHPYHTMPVLLTQALLHKDQEMVRNARYKKQLEDRVQAASHLVERIKKDRKLGPLAQKMEQLWIALISLANFQDKGNSTGNANMPKDAKIRTLKGLELVAVPTTTVPVSISAEYKDNIIGIQSFEFIYTLVGGINSPKRITCTGTNGTKFNMLLKGQDDLRQDAVMQQVFGVMNKLLLAETKTKTRRLHVRTYKVVPLSQRSGILEWCENTQTFGDYLVTENIGGAHQKYRPNDYTPQECRRKMLDVKDCGDNEKKYGNFMTILEHFKPVFRHFFFENFKEAGMFFERRLAYTRSVATNSMVGYILGLGDRHVLNILVDKTTAEFIHIDLGVAFEQGRILPTPETIPFRLTRDVVDGMGISGVEGVFRKSCEMTLDVLRNNSEIILTILEVLLYDPLYMWTLTADRMKKVQPAENSRGPLNKRSNGNTSIETSEDAPKERNTSAARVLLRLRQKLAGVEESGSSGSMLSVQGHVSLLIQRALDPEKLSRLFPGWQPYL